MAVLHCRLKYMNCIFQVQQESWGVQGLIPPSVLPLPQMSLVEAGSPFLHSNTFGDPFLKITNVPAKEMAFSWIWLFHPTRPWQPSLPSSPALSSVGGGLAGVRRCPTTCFCFSRTSGLASSKPQRSLPYSSRLGAEWILQLHSKKCCLYCTVLLWKPSVGLEKGPLGKRFMVGRDTNHTNQERK